MPKLWDLSHLPRLPLARWLPTPGLLWGYGNPILPVIWSMSPRFQRLGSLLLELCHGMRLLSISSHKQHQAWQSTAFTFATSTGPCTRPRVWLPAPMDRQAQGQTRFQHSSVQQLPFTPQVATNALLASPHSCNHALCILRISSELSKQVEWVPWMLSKLTVRIKNVNWRECSFLKVNSNCSGVILNCHQQQRWFSQKWLFKWSEQERRYWENPF